MVLLFLFHFSSTPNICIFLLQSPYPFSLSFLFLLHWPIISLFQVFSSLPFSILSFPSLPTNNPPCLQSCWPVENCVRIKILNLPDIFYLQAVLIVPLFADQANSVASWYESDLGHFCTKLGQIGCHISGSEAIKTIVPWTQQLLLQQKEVLTTGLQ